MGASWADRKSKKSSFKSVVFSYFTQQQTISQSDGDMQQKVDCIWQLLTISSVVGPRRSFKALPKAKLAPEKGHGGLLLAWSTTAFWILMNPLHLRSMLSKLMRCTKNCNACSCHGSTETAQFSTTMPDHTLHNQCFKSWTNWAVEFCFIHHICLTSVVIYGCESWTIKKAECWRISNCTREDFWESLEQQGDQTSQF